MQCARGPARFAIGTARFTRSKNIEQGAPRVRYSSERSGSSMRVVRPRAHAILDASCGLAGSLVGLHAPGDELTDAVERHKDRPVPSAGIFVGLKVLELLCTRRGAQML